MCIIFKIVNPTFKQTASNETVINWHTLRMCIFQLFLSQKASIFPFAVLQFCSFKTTKPQNRKPQTVNKKQKNKKKFK